MGALEKIKRIVKSKFLRDTGTLQAGAMFVSLGNILSAVGLAYLLGPERQGEFYVAISLYSFLWFLVNLGLVQVTVSKVSAALASKDREGAIDWLAYLFKAYAVLGVLVGGVGFLVLPWAAENILHASPQVGFYAVVLAFTPLLDLPRVVTGAGFQATRRMLPLAQSDNAFEFVRVYLVLLGALLTGDLRGPVIAQLTASALGSLIAFALYIKECKQHPELLPSPGEILSHVRRVPLRKGIAVGVRMGAVQNLNALGMQILPALLLQRFGSSSWVAYLRISQRIMNVPMMFMQAISRTALPLFSNLAGTKNMRKMCLAYFRTSLFSGLTIGVGILLFLPLLPFIVERVLPPNYHEPIGTICWILAPGFVLLSFSIANGTFYLVTDTLHVGILVSIVGALINLPLIAYLAWSYPTVGVAWGLTISMAWSLWHPCYAYYWYRKNVVRGGIPASLPQSS
ncbi:MAG: O-antigen/teichoic acid export membrane protein [Candidatus Paceibacteria bacterium]|jgi:O-antigen/teichoic acid export membrane protein